MDIEGKKNKRYMQVWANACKYLSIYTNLSTSIDQLINTHTHPHTPLEWQQGNWNLGMHIPSDKQTHLLASDACVMLAEREM